MDDLISRQMAVDAICKEWCNCSHDDCENKTMMENGFDPCDGCSDVDAIMDLPSAQANLQPTCNQLATDCISRQAAIDAVSRGCWEFRGIFAECEKNLNELPSAQPEVIRCKDCKHYYFADNRIPQEQRYTCELDGDRWKPDDYCSYAERRNDG